MNLSQLTKKGKEYALAFTVVIVAVVGLTHTASGHVVGDNINVFIPIDPTPEFLDGEVTITGVGVADCTIFAFETRVKRPNSTGRGRLLRGVLLWADRALPVGTVLGDPIYLFQSCQTGPVAQIRNFKFQFTIVRIR